MKPLAAVLSVLLLAGAGGSLVADQYAFTESGEKVLLRDDGTWSPVAEPGADESARDGFRTVAWGSDLETVYAAENDPPLFEEGGAVAYMTKVAGLDALAAYRLTNGILTSGVYIFTSEHSNKNDYIQDYRSIGSLLTEKYGAPANDEVFWKNDLYQDDRDEWGFAVSLGHLSYWKTWETAESEIILMLTGENYEISLRLEYSSVAFSELEQAKREQESKEGL